MGRFVCDDNKNIASLLHKLSHLCEQAGAQFHKNLRFSCKDGNFTAFADQRIENGEPVLVMPADVFVPVQNVSFSLKNGKISIDACHTMSALQTEIIHVLIEIYNSVDKYETYKETSVIRLFFEEPDLFELLMQRYKSDAGYVSASEFSDHDEFLYKNFMSLRAIDIGTARKGPSKANSLLPGDLIPFLEYFNHHPKAFPISEVANLPGNGRVAQLDAYSVPDSDELFISYGFFDAHQQFVCQSFVDENCFFSRSIPMVFEIPGLASVEIGRQMVKLPGSQIPRGYEDVGFYFPVIHTSKDPHKVFLGSIKIPMAGAPKSMRRILRYAFERIFTHDDIISQAVLFAERQILEKNINYYSEIGAQFANRTPKPSMEKLFLNVQKMLDVQCANIMAYPFYSDVMGGEKQAGAVCG